MFASYRESSQTRLKQPLLSQRKSLSLPKNNTQPTLLRKDRGSWMEKSSKDDEAQGRSVKELIDDYFKDDINFKMPIIKQKQSFFQKQSRWMQQRKPKSLRENEEFSKSIVYPLLKENQK